MAFSSQNITLSIVILILEILLLREILEVTHHIYEGLSN